MISVLLVDCQIPEATTRIQEEISKRTNIIDRFRGSNSTASCSIDGDLAIDEILRQTSNVLAPLGLGSSRALRSPAVS